MRRGQVTTASLWATVALTVAAVGLHLKDAGFDGLSRETMVLALPVFAAFMGHRGRRFPRLAMGVSFAALLFSVGGLMAVLNKAA